MFEGYELEDALEAANAALEDDVSVLEEDGSTGKVQPFKREEVLKPLERWFFGEALGRPVLPSASVLIRLGHSPDPDDAFMVWALAEDRVDTRGLEFEHVLADIQTLNGWAREGRLEVTAISSHTYPYVQERYVLLPHGASMGSGYGPVVVAPSRCDSTPCVRRRSPSRGR